MALEYYVKISEYVFRAKLEDRYRSTYVLGPYKTSDEAVNQYYTAHLLYKDDFDAEGKSLYWDYIIYHEETEDVEPAC